MLTRSATSAQTTIFASNGSAGTFGAHYAFSCGVQLPNGDRYVIARKGSSHASWDGVAVSKVGASASALAAASTITLTALTPSGEEYRGGTMRLLSTGKLGHAYFTRTQNQFPGTIYPDGYRAYYTEGTISGSTVSWRSPTRITGLSGIDDNNNALEDFVELPNGELLFVTCGIVEFPTQAQFFNNFSFRGNAAGTAFGSVLTMALGTQVNRNAVEPSVTMLPDGRAFAQFHFEQSQDGFTEVNAKAYQQTSTDATVTAWTLPTLWGTAWNRYATLLTEDQDLIFGYAPSNTDQVFRQSDDIGASYGSPIAVNSTSASGGSTWLFPFKIGAQGTDPNIAFVFSNESSGQNIGNVFYREYTRGSDILPAVGYGNTVSSGYGEAEAYAPVTLLTIDPASTAWEQVGTAITVRTVAQLSPTFPFLPLGSSTVSATVLSTNGGLMRLRGDDADLFALSLDGSSWSDMIDIDSGASTVYLRVTPVAPNTTLTAEIGVPV